jgi:uncharacterized protein (TIGR00255 family)
MILSQMIQSMTGYAAASAESARGRLSLELRSVNARFLDLQFRVADELRALEPALREMVSARITRGKVDCRLFLNEGAAAQAPRRLDPEALARFRALAGEARAAFPDAGEPSLADVLRWPGIVAEPRGDDDALRAAASALCASALDELVSARSREGATLAASIGGRVAAMRGRLAEVAPLVPQAIAAYQARIAERLREALGSSDDDRVRAEIALFAAKADIDEELTRLHAHLAEVERTLRQGGAVGKRLDFLAQELNREANTLASKAASQQVADCGLELKLLIEQMREQVQNLE